MLIVRYKGALYPQIMGGPNPDILYENQLYEVKCTRINGSLKLYQLVGLECEGFFPDALFSKVGNSYDTDDTEVFIKLNTLGEEWIRVS